MSCDLLPADDGSEHHHQGDVLAILNEGWDLMVAHPPCTYLCSSGLHWNKRGAMVNGRPRAELTEEALEFVRLLLAAPIKHIALENPKGCIGTRVRPADQLVQPYQFGDDASKQTYFWLKNLPNLAPTLFVPPRIVAGKKRWGNQTDSGQNRESETADRWKIRSLTYQGIAEAIGEQWGSYVMENLK